MRQLLLEGPGLWRRGNGDVVKISEMIYQHLTNAHRIVNDRLEQARFLFDRAKAQHANPDLPEALRMTESEAKIAFAEFESTIAALVAKAKELADEIRRRPSPLLSND